MNESEVPSTMRALQIDQYGPPSVLQYVETPTPSIASPQQIIVRVIAAGVNPGEWKARKGNLSTYKNIKFPAILGGDYSGIIIAKGEGVKDFQIGEEVFGTLADCLCGNGSYAEYILIDTEKDAIAKKPQTITHSEAAGAGIGLLAAWDGLIVEGKLPIGEEAQRHNPKVLIIGASGGVGSFAVQLAKKVNHAHVTAICSGKNSEIVRKLGADRVVDYTTQDFAKVLRNDETESFDLVFDCVGGDDYYTKSVDLLKKTGIFVTAVGPEEHYGVEKVGFVNIAKFAGGTLMKKAFGGRTYVIILRLPYRDFAKIVPYLDRREVITLVTQEFELKDGGKAHESSETLRVVGKIILKTFT